MIIFSSNYLQKTQFRLNIFLKFEKKPWGHSGAFGGIWGQISDIVKSRQIIPQNEALGKSFSKKVVLRSKKVNKGQKSQKKAKKNQISEFIKRTQITRQNEALGASFPEKLSSKVKKRRKKTKKGQISNFMKIKPIIYCLYVKMNLLA